MVALFLTGGTYTLAPNITIIFQVPIYGIQSAQIKLTTAITERDIFSIYCGDMC